MVDVVVEGQNVNGWTISLSGCVDYETACYGQRTVLTLHSWSDLPMTMDMYQLMMILFKHLKVSTFILYFI